jgi:hypothetical protein
MDLWLNSSQFDHYLPFSRYHKLLFTLGKSTLAIIETVQRMVPGRRITTQGLIQWAIFPIDMVPYLLQASRSIQMLLERKL